MTPIDQIDDRSVILALQEFTEEAGLTLGEADARQLMEHLLEAGGAPATDLDQALNESSARRLLTLMAADPETGATIGEILADPPMDEQLSVEAALVSVVVLAALTSWLQTKIDIRLTRKDGKTEFTLHAHKTHTDPKTLSKIIKACTEVIRGRQ